MDFTGLNDLILELQNRNEFELEFEIGEPIIDEDDYNPVEEKFDWNPRKMFHNIINVHDGIDLAYRIKGVGKGGTEIGEVKIMMFFCLFDEMMQENYYAHHELDGMDIPKEYFEFWNKYYPLDIYKDSQSEQIFTVVKPIDEDELEFWIWDSAGPKFKLIFKTYEEYLNAGIKNKFIVFWQYFYIDSNSMDFSDDSINITSASDFSGATIKMDWALEQMSQHFQNEDWSYQAREMKRLKEL